MKMKSPIIVTFVITLLCISMSNSASAICIPTNPHFSKFLEMSSPDKVAEMTQVYYDRHQNVTRVISPEVIMCGPPYYFIRGLIYQETAPMLQIYVRAVAGDWLFLDRAFSEGRRLDLTEIDHETGHCGRNGCILYEHVGINLTVDELRALAAQDRPFEFQVPGRRGSVEVSVPSGYIQGFLRRFDEAMQQAKP